MIFNNQTQQEQFLTSQRDLLQSQLQDVLKPNILVSELSQIILQLLIDHTAYLKAHRATEKSEQYKSRLLRILSITTDLNGIGDQNTSLKINSKHVSAENRQLLNRIKELECQLSNINQAFQEE